MKFEAAKAVSNTEEVKQPTCTYCHQEVMYPDWECGSQPGNHTLPMKQYFTLGGQHLQDRRDRRRYHLTMILKPASESFGSSGLVANSPQVLIEFNDGKAQTDDCEKQYYLDRCPDVLSGVAGEQAWRKVYLTDSQQAEAAKAELVALESKLRQVRESASLLDGVKQGAS